ncbi:hypothetical protein N7512_006228 [Penicillium capsulatum]|nr:hypothetical protein N7512_006228 [Penicillium capsulatum]
MRASRSRSTSRWIRSNYWQALRNLRIFTIAQIRSFGTAAETRPADRCLRCCSGISIRKWRWKTTVERSRFKMVSPNLVPVNHGDAMPDLDDPGLRTHANGEATANPGLGRGWHAREESSPWQWPRLLQARTPRTRLAVGPAGSAWWRAKNPLHMASSSASLCRCFWQGTGSRRAELPEHETRV